MSRAYIDRWCVAVGRFIACFRQEAPPDAWTIDKGLSQPESAYYDAGSQSIFISNLAGRPDEKDGKGWITRADINGKVVETEWVKGLNAPKGMRSVKGILWVSDIDRVIGIEIKSGQQKHTVEIKDAKFLNDVAVDNEGVVYVSDMFGNKIYSIKDGKPAVFAEGEELALPNGLVVHEDQLVVASWGSGFDAANFTTKAPGHVYEIDTSSAGRRTSRSDRWEIWMAWNWTAAAATLFRIGWPARCIASARPAK